MSVQVLADAHKEVPARSCELPIGTMRHDIPVTIHARKRLPTTAPSATVLTPPYQYL